VPPSPPLFFQEYNVFIVISYFLESRPSCPCTFTTALLPVSFADVLGKFTDRYSLTPAAWWMLLYGAIATPLTALGMDVGI
jgi:hypothetical protein